MPMRTQHAQSTKQSLLSFPDGVANYNNSSPEQMNTRTFNPCFFPARTSQSQAACPQPSFSTVNVLCEFCCADQADAGYGQPCQRWEQSGTIAYTADPSEPSGDVGQTSDVLHLGPVVAVSARKSMKEHSMIKSKKVKVKNPSMRKVLLTQNELAIDLGIVL
jgi:hypothetical protein